MAPTLFIVPGFWEGPTVFEPLAAALRSAGYNVFITSLVSTGQDSKAGLTSDDDVAAIASDLSRVVEEAGREGVVGFCHSIAGLLGPAAMKGLTAPARKKEGKQGGVTKIILFTAGAAPEGSQLQPQPFFDVNEEKGTHTCVDIENNFFSDFSPEMKQEWMPKVSVQPAHGWEKTVTFTAWKEVPSTYIIAEDDVLLPAAFQEKFAAVAGSSPILRMKGGHLAQISQTAELAKLVNEILKG